MAVENKTIGELDAATELTGSELLVLEQDGAAKSVTPELLKDFIDTQPTIMDFSTFDSGTFTVDGQTYTWVDADGGTTGDPVTFTRPDGTTLTVTW